MSWWQAVPVVAAAIAIALLPGAVVGAALGLRRLTLWAFAPAFSFSVIAITALANQVIAFRWGFVPLIVATAMLAAIAFLLSLIWRRRSVDSSTRLTFRWGGAALLAGLAVAGLAIALRLREMFGAPDHIAQRFDNIYHLNAVRWILENQSASPFQMASLTFDVDGRLGFYPNLWHAYTALVAQTTAGSIPVALNAAAIAVSAVVWPLACVLLTRQIVGPKPVALFAAGALSGGFAAFPYLMLDFGVLYPTLLAVALLPLALAGVLIALREGASEPMHIVAGWLVLAGTLPGLALAHPTLVVSLLVITLPLGVSVALRQLRVLRRRNARPTEFLGVVGAAAAWILVLAAVFVLARPSTEALRPPVQTVGQAVESVLTGALPGQSANYLIALFALVGIAMCFRRGGPRWLAFAWLLSSALYVVAASLAAGSLRTAVTGFWYDDPFRLVAILPVVVLPLAVVGILGVARVVSAIPARQVTPANSAAVARQSTAIAGLLVILIGIGSQSGAGMAQQMRSGQQAYALTNNSQLLTLDELALLERIDDEVPEDSIVAGNPSTGTSLVYAFAGRRALFPHIFADFDADAITLVYSLRDADSDPAVCDAADDLDVDFVLEFAGADVDGIDRSDFFGGLENLRSSNAVELVDREGQAALYRLTACDD